MSKINLLDKEALKVKLNKTKLRYLYPFIILGILSFAFIFNVITSEEGFVKYMVRNLHGFTPSADRLQEVTDDETRINILLLGHGGFGHDGPNLTDSIHVVSINKETNKATMISIPRDLLVDIPDYGKRKINHAFALTEQDEAGSGGLVASKVVENVLGIKIHNYATINFAGFTKIVDDLKGVDVNVPHGFIDYQYPAPDHLYQTISFDQGWQTMDGETALQFARSRHGICTTACEQPEGSDFARAKRQQLILKALKDKMLSSRTWKNPKNIYTILSAYNDYIQTNIGLLDIKEFYTLAKETDTSDITQFVIDATPRGLLKAANISGAYVLIPKTGMDNFDQIQVAVDNLLYPKVIGPLDENQEIFVEIQNGTTIGGFASYIANNLEDNGVKITKVGNAEQQNKSETIIYDFSGGEKPDLIQKIQQQLPGAQVSIDIPQKILTEHQEQHIIKINNTPIPTERKTDFLVILGSDLYATLGLENF